MNLRELIDSLNEHFVGLWIYQPYGKIRMWCVTFRDINKEYWESDLFDEPEDALRQVVKIIVDQKAGAVVTATGQNQQVKTNVE
jgi:hypothetical protein